MIRGEEKKGKSRKYESQTVIEIRNVNPEGMKVLGHEIFIISDSR